MRFVMCHVRTCRVLLQVVIKIIRAKVSDHSLFFLFKQKTAYEMRISDWSSDVCSSDLSFKGFAKFRTTSIDDTPRGRERALRLVAGAAVQKLTQNGQIGRASCRESVCQYV